MKKLVFIALLLLALVMALSACSGKNTDQDIPESDDYNVSVAQVGKEQKFTLTWDKKDTLASIIVTVKHGDTVANVQTIEGDAIANGSAEIDAYYGKHSVTVVTANKNGDKTQTTKELVISGDEFIIAPISGSMPQLYFTLNMKEITNGYTIPTFVWLARPGSWDWEKLPANVYAMPTVDISEVLTHNNFNRMVEVTDAYIEELYSINPDAKFHLYINDYNTYLYPKLMAGNGIPEENYDVVLLSDGGASYTEFQNAFNSTDANFDADAKYAEMAQKFQTLMTEVREAKDYNWTQTFTVDTTAIRTYSYVIAKEMKNVEWWVLRPRTDTFICPDEEFITKLLAEDVLKATDGVYVDTENNVILERNFNTPLTMMTDEEKATLKDFYSFNDEMFAEAEEQGKKAMMFLGSWASDTNEPDFYAYVNFMKAYYGDEFVYYYKGHPSTPTSNYPHKQQQLKDLNLIDVESSINAELILFFYPDIYMCGYNSSTFMSADKDEMACAIFNMTKEGCTNDYAPRIGLFVSKIAPENYAYFAECKSLTNSYFLVEFNNVESDYAYAIYDATENKIINGPAKDSANNTYNVSAAQVEKEQKFTLTWDKNDAISSIIVTVKHGDMVVTTKTIEGDAIASGSAEIDAYYGKHSVSVVVTNKAGIKEQTTLSVSLSADEYVIAPISGSMPQLYFTLNMKEITNGYTIPTFVWLARPGSWNWDKLPTNVYAMPTVDISEVLTHNNYDRMVEVTDAYIEELYMLNPDAKFHLYINDYNTYLYPKLMAGNGIPEENYTVVLLSDGGASYKEFQNAFNSEDASFDADAKYAEMAEKLAALMTEVREANDYNWTQTFTVDTSAIRSYAYVIAKEMTNVEWWVLRPRTDTLICPDADFVAAILANDVLKATNGVYVPTENNVIVERNFNTPLTVMTEEEKTALKDFYSFNDEMFAEAEAQGKKAMMFLGSWASDTNEPDFYAYVNFMKAYYGDEFVYYYKGHPSTPTSNYPHKQQQLKDLDLIDVESSINAELILFFYPDIYMCGYNSSTFMSADKDEMACAIFNMTKEGCTNDYAPRIGLFVSKIAAENYASYAECADATHSYFLVEFNNVESDYQYAIYDATANVIINGPAK